MANLIRIAWWGVATTPLVLLPMAGCGRVDEAALLTEQRLRVISTAYLDYAVARGQGPANEGELRSHLANSAAAKFSMVEFGMENSQALFVSARDGAPFVLRFGVPIGVTRSGAAEAIAYEASGQDATRFVARADGKIECTADEEVAPSVK